MNELMQSLQARLVVRLAAVLLIAAIAGVAALFHESDLAADQLRREELLQRAGELARSIVQKTDGSLAVQLSPGLDQVFHAPGVPDLFIIRSEHGAVLATSRSELAASAGSWPLAGNEPRYTRVKQFGPNDQEFCSLTLRAGSATAPLSVTVARPLDGDALVHSVLGKFVRDIAWAIALFAIAILAVGVWSIRRGLYPLRSLSARAAEIGAETADVRLPVDRLPSELLPLVSAFNQALDRLERTLILQREFTANAAHQLRTPLAILTAQLEELPAGTTNDLLRSDAARMNRLIDQLLRVARLDNAPLAVDNPVDLRAAAADVVRFLAPWAVSRRRTIGLDAPESPIWAKGNADAIDDALRNLVENAVIHTPERTEVTVSVSADCEVAVADCGPGVPRLDRERIFERFWRGRAERCTGAGLGLAIVAQVANAHGGSIEVDDAPGQGAVFRFRLKPAVG